MDIKSIEDEIKLLQTKDKNAVDLKLFSKSLKILLDE